jgi:hypothetical protein
MPLLLWQTCPRVTYTPLESPQGSTQLPGQVLAVPVVHVIDPATAICAAVQWVPNSVDHKARLVHLWVATSKHSNTLDG